MHAFRTIVFSSVIAGLLVGSVITSVQQVGTAPLILRAEIYERAAGAGAAVAAAPVGHEAAGPGAQGHEHAAWEPADGVQRTASSAAANVLTATGFALLLCGAYVLRGGQTTWREGALWGLGGFAAFVAAPGLGLPPELPGMPAAALGPRQLWWAATAGATAFGLALLAFRRSSRAVVLAFALFVSPHLIGAPRPLDPSTDVPAALAREFVVAAVLTGLLFWLLLGCLTGAVYGRLSVRARGPARSRHRSSAAP